jgi:hypothetical protein
MPTVLKSGSLNFLETNGPVQACNGIALPLTLPIEYEDSCVPETARMVWATLKMLSVRLCLTLCFFAQVDKKSMHSMELEEINPKYDFPL